MNVADHLDTAGILLLVAKMLVDVVKTLLKKGDLK